MPKTTNGFLIDESTNLTKQQVIRLQELINAGKEEEAQRYLDEIITGWENPITGEPVESE
jgi:hypothetical protein